MTEPAQAGTDAAPQPNPLVRLAVETGPLVAFFITNARAGIFWATAVFMVAVVVSLAYSRITERRWPIMPLVTACFVLVFGTLTLVLQDELFIKLKPTIVNVCFAATLFGGLAVKRSLLRPLFGAAFQLTDEGWRVLTVRWAFFFAFLAVLNEVVWRNFTTDTWVHFKVWGIMPLTVVFMLTQMPLIQRHQLEPGQDEAS